jgi:hypothetical protein
MEKSKAGQGFYRVYRGQRTGQKQVNVLSYERIKRSHRERGKKLYKIRIITMFAIGRETDKKRA